MGGPMRCGSVNAIGLVLAMLSRVPSMINKHTGYPKRQLSSFPSETSRYYPVLYVCA